MCQSHSIDSSNTRRINIGMWYEFIRTNCVQIKGLKSPPIMNVFIVTNSKLDLNDESPSTFEPGYCSPNPYDRTAAIWSKDGTRRESSPYIGTVVSSSSSSATVYRPPSESRKFLTVPSTRIDWLLEPKFIKAFDQPDSVIFFVVEKSVEVWPMCAVQESSSIGLYSCFHSRVIRICKDDRGGSKFPFSNEWISFRKARLICTDSGANRTSAMFDHMVDAVKIKLKKTGQEIIYAAFVIKIEHSHVSVICRYDLDNIQKLFDNGYLKVADDRGIWHRSTYPSGMNCQKLKSQTTVKENETRERHVILDDVINPLDGIVFRVDAEITQLASKELETDEIVIMIGTSDGRVIKTISDTDKNLWIAAEWQLGTPITSLSISTTNRYEKSYSRFVYAGTQNRIYQLSFVDQCAGYRTQTACWRDVDCSWNLCDKSCLYTPKMKRSKLQPECVAVNGDTAAPVETVNMGLISLTQTPVNLVKLLCSEGLNSEWKKDGVVLSGDNIISSEEGLVLTWTDDLTASFLAGTYTCLDQTGRLISSYKLELTETNASKGMNGNLTVRNEKCIDDKMFLVQYNRWCEQLERYEHEYLKWQSTKEKKCELINEELKSSF
ncbi:hypothetical protein ACOME3_001557 [Neoechinorhynchus agilis]